MDVTQLPGQTLEPLPANSGPVGDDEHSLLQKCVESSYNLAANNGGAGQHALWFDDDYALLSKFLYNLNRSY